MHIPRENMKCQGFTTSPEQKIKKLEQLNFDRAPATPRWITALNYESISMGRGKTLAHI